MVLEVPSALSSHSTRTLQETFEQAVLYFICSSPKQEAEALKVVKAISDFAAKYKLLEESDFE